MKIRELLRTEVWSKKTSRRVLIGIGIVLVGFGSWVAIELCWLSPGERDAARIALAQIDSLQRIDSIRDDDFSAGDKQAARSVEIAKQTAWTERDKDITELLSMFLGFTQIDREDLQKRKLLQQTDPPEAHRGQEFALEMETMGKGIRLGVQLRLHRALD